MNITALLYNAVRRFRGPGPDDSNGACGLAPYIGITAVSLSHKVSPTYPSTHCSPEEVLAICKLTGDHEPLRAMAKDLGYALLPLAPAHEEPDDAWAERLTDSVKEFGEYVTTASVSYADKKVSDAEMAGIEREFNQAMAGMSRVHAYLRDCHAKGTTVKPGSRRK